MKIRLKKLSTVMMAAIVMVSMITIPVKAADMVTAKVTGKYGQTEARKMLAMMNSFRTGSDAWYWNPDDTTKATGLGLGTLTYDYDLEKAAMQRAMEVALSFSHTRPSGKSWSTVEPAGTSGENIAAGQTTALAAFTSWQEKDDKYAGQGHRRNMLSSSFHAVGIGHVYYQGTHYWVQEFGTSVSGSGSVAANDSTVTKDVEIAKSSITSCSLTPSVKSITVAPGASVTLPKVTSTIGVVASWPSSGREVELPMTYTVANTAYASVSGGKLTGKTVGSTTLRITALDKTVTIPVTVGAKKVTKIKLSGISHKIAAGKKITLKAAVTPANAGNKKVTWKTSNKKVATVSSSGVVKMKKGSGGKKVTITATAKDGSKVKGTFKITSMKGIVKKIKITGKKTVKAGKSIKLKAKVTASKKANKTLKWKTSNKKYATVTSTGKVKALKAGKKKTVKITASATDGSGKKKTVKIKIK